MRLRTGRNCQCGRPLFADFHRTDTSRASRDKKNTLDKAFDDIQQETHSQYSVAWKPANAATNGNYHAIEVRQKNADYTVQARKGYYSGRAPEPAQGGAAHGASQ